MASIHICKSCGGKFPTAKAFNDHACVLTLQDKSLDDLMALYRQQQAAPKSTTTKQ